MGKRGAVSCGFERDDKSLYTNFSTSRQRFASTSGGLWTEVETMAGGVAYETSIRETN